MSSISGHTLTFPEQDTAENRLKKTLFIVEADSFAQHELWCIHASDSCFPPWNFHNNRRAYGEPVKWEQVNPGWLVTVGHMKALGKRMPVCISVSWVRIDGQLIMFWYACSMVTHLKLIERWLNKHFTGKYDKGTRRAECDAMNFGHCLEAIDEANKSAGSSPAARR